MTTCTTNQGCKKCVLSDTTQKMMCGTAYMENGYCTCTATSSPDGSSGCNISGNCTYQK